MKHLALALLVACGSSSPSPQQPPARPAAPTPTPETEGARTEAPPDAGTFASLTGTGDITGGGSPGSEGGYGIGSGGGGQPVAVPTVSIGMPTVAGKGELDKAIIRRYIKRNIQKIQYCYEKQLLANPTIGGGTVTTSFTVEDTGKVTGSTATGLDPTTATCIANVIKDIEFPKPLNNASVVVTYPFTFRPAGS